MIPGVTALGVYAISHLPSEYDNSEIDSLTLFLAAPFGERVYLLEAQPYDLNSAALTTVLLANRDFTTSPTDALVSRLFKGLLITPFNVQASVFSGGRLATRSIPAYGESRVANADGEADEIAEYSWAERALTIKAGLPTFRYDQFGIIFTGTAEGLTWYWDEIALRLRDYQYKLARPLQASLYGGFGGCLRHDGVDDYSRSGVIGTLQEYTWECWFRCNGATGSNQHILSLFDTWTATGIEFYAYVSPVGAVSVLWHRSSGGAASCTDAGYDYRDGRRHHFAITAADDGITRTGALYIDGELKGTAVLPVQTARPNAKVDCGGVGGIGGFGKLEIDDVREWSIVRTRAEILDTKGRELLGDEPGLSNYWKLNEQTGGAALNSVAGGVPITPTGAAWIGSLEGDSSVAGKPKPKSYGQVRQVEPVPVDSLNLIFQWADGPVLAVNLVQDAGVPLTAAGDVADLYATTVTAGTYKTDNSKGLIRLGSSPVGTLTLDGQGDASGTGYVSTAADIMRRIVSTSGGLVDPTGLDTASFSAANTANSAIHNYHSRLDPVNVESALDELASSIGAFWTYTRDGLFRVVVVVAPGLATVSLTDEDFVVDTVRRVTIPPPVKRIRLGYRKYWTTQEGDALATSVSVANRSRFKEAYSYVTSDNSTIATVHLDAEEMQAHTLMDTVASAQAEADRRKVLYGVERRLIHLRLVVGLFTFQIGDTIEFSPSVTRYGLGGWKGVIVGIVEDVGDGSAAEVIEIDLWG